MSPGPVVAAMSPYKHKLDRANINKWFQDGVNLTFRDFEHAIIYRRTGRKPEMSFQKRRLTEDANDVVLWVV
jgi:hypothetical protein